MADGLATRVTVDPGVMGGKPCIRGMRVTVSAILAMLADGGSEREILEAYPYLEPLDIKAALAFGAWRSEDTDVPIRHFHAS
ncbi:MAG: DUF433 domain-containing protein [Phycisphaerales bacterium]|jgi:uncharacterized protein (DUF433 family)